MVKSKVNEHLKVSYILTFTACVSFEMHGAKIYWIADLRSASWVGLSFRSHYETFNIYIYIYIYKWYEILSHLAKCEESWVNVRSVFMMPHREQWFYSYGGFVTEHDCWGQKSQLTGLASFNFSLNGFCWMNSKHFISYNAFWLHCI